MPDKRQKNQPVLAFLEKDRGEAPKCLREGRESAGQKARPSLNSCRRKSACGKTARRHWNESGPTKGVPRWTAWLSTIHRDTWSGPSGSTSHRS